VNLENQRILLAAIQEVNELADCLYFDQQYAYAELVKVEALRLLERLNNGVSNT
jgi:hypothetical protein